MRRGSSKPQAHCSGALFFCVFLQSPLQMPTSAAIDARRGAVAVGLRGTEGKQRWTVSSSRSVTWSTPPRTGKIRQQSAQLRPPATPRRQRIPLGTSNPSIVQIGHFLSPILTRTLLRAATRTVFSSSGGGIGKLSASRPGGWHHLPLHSTAHKPRKQVRCRTIHGVRF